MYSNCLFCKSNLGSNEAIEHFTVGGRLAFDSAKGRLWVVCRRCGRWNLSPLEERWEAVEECERLFSATRTRYSTEQIGLARHASGLDLIRVGRPQRPEFAAWRFGEQFGARFRRGMLLSGGTLAVGAGSVLGGATAAAITGGSGMLIYLAVGYGQLLHQQLRPVTRLPAEESGTRILRGKHVARARLLPSGDRQGWQLTVPYGSETIEIRGEEAILPAGQIFAHWNSWGARKKAVRAAVEELEREDRPERYFATALRRLEVRPLAPAVEGERFDVSHLPHEVKLALEMAAAEELERQALEGELRILEEAWREAEEIAAIADRLLLPARLEEFIAKHRNR